jgi:hypothetical protein
MLPLLNSLERSLRAENEKWTKYVKDKENPFTRLYFAFMIYNIKWWPYRDGK